ncbi:class I SAM-dependent methyltransferase [Salinirubellus salinus]|uniref:Class I SAM-dependent methyltransferase n=1 Tax=Salinirubellus salinus TaxID=1364945 RepID=A0A9E7R837_9EURY|nr:class I SAM-dependent methyltransferase [Salinirubellus salinus]UWM56395.1 class I SAM-dependent methyltransferase [Salinirubellus salinus]
MAGNSPADPTRSGVRATYEEIAEGFAATREYAWPEVVDFVEDASDGAATGLDVGCGNGRHSELLAEHVTRVVGVDASRSLVALARARARERGWAAAFDPVVGDAATLPLADDSVDLAVYVATLHHLPTRALRVRSLRELGRVLAPDGRALVSAWSTEHDRFVDHDAGFDTTVDWTLPDGKTVGRFYHIYDPAEFDADLERAGLTVVSSVVSSGNCYARVRT